MCCTVLYAQLSTYTQASVSRDLLLHSNVSATIDCDGASYDLGYSDNHDYEEPEK